MNKNSITQNQYIFINISSMIAVGILSMASTLCKIAHQQAWISLFIGGIYPICIVITASIIDNKTNHASFWEINNEIYGKILSYIFTFIFFCFYLSMFAGIASGFTNVLKLTITYFLPSSYIIVPTIVLTIFISIHGIYMVGRISEFYFYLTLPLIFILLFFIIKGSVINVKPIISSVDEIIKAVPESFYSFSGCEISYLIISKISNKKNTKKAGIIAVLITTFIYVFTVFMTIYYLGWELTSKLEYPLLYLIETIPIPIISNFTALFLALWSVIILRSLITVCFAANYSLSLLIKNENYYKKAYFIFVPLAICYIYLLLPEYNRSELLGIVFPPFIFFGLLWGLLTALLASRKFRGGNNESI
ncbi:GerAB/ArcD/ProY family transporter [Oceanirhabdus sp. W0125-5]|uniref:GerAB/ArcD/ProY family transporter n=1 Tax=Oceanirhabdus sp. W0125-5 TaxID=2999116 RepID=UPI0022F2DFA7|nr:endospore germination permease [Oceanirhabdus sp. W0125-5]WBW95643.1 endospore germination permease [Oceanirhabdus sp. W0125-5]